MKAFVLAAGYGTRMEELTCDLPKPLLAVGGYPLIYYSLFWLWKWDIEEVVINLHYLGEKIERYLSNFSHFPIHFSYEKKILGTAGGIRNCIGKQISVEESFVLLNPDSILIAGAKDHPQEIQRKLAKGRMESFEKDRDFKNTGSNRKSTQKEIRLCNCILGLKKRSSKNFSGISYKSAQNPQIRFAESGTYYYMGYSVLNAKELLSIPTFADSSQPDLGPVWKELAEQNRLLGFPFSGKILDAGTKASYLALRECFPLPKALYSDWQEFLAGAGTRKSDLPGL